MPQRNPTNKHPRGLEHCPQQPRGEGQFSSSTEFAGYMSHSRNQSQHVNTQAANIRRTDTIQNSQHHNDDVFYRRQFTPYWDDFNGIIYEISSSSALRPTKTYAQRATRGQYTQQQQNPYAEFVRERSYEEEDTSSTVSSALNTAQEHKLDAKKGQSLGSCTVRRRRRGEEREVSSESKINHTSDKEVVQIKSSD
jgi:CRISPR/Cas system-associated protein Cas5 (RAMP superfamily)